MKLLKGRDIMKKIFILGFLIIFNCATITVTSDKTEIVKLPGQSKQKIYQKSLQWITYTFVSGRAVTDYKDAAMGRIIAKGKILLGNVPFYTAYVYEVATIDCVNGKAKINITSVGCALEGPGGAAHGDCPCSDQYIGGWVSELDNVGDKLISQYKTYMLKGGAPAWDGK
jgi:hypothetical protein